MKPSPAPQHYRDPAALDVLVSGASRGIGLALVEQLLERGSTRRVYAGARTATSAPRLTELARAWPDRLRLLDMDLCDEASLAAALERVGAEVDALDITINCVGLLHEGETVWPEKRLADVSVAALERSFAVNAIGPLLLARQLQPLLPRNERAVLANLSARVGSIGDNRLGGWYSYRASKAAQNMITRTLSIELARRARGIVCVALHPGSVDTGLSAPFQAGVPAGRLFTPERAARQLLEVIDGLRAEDNGGFFAWDGSRIPW
ncbi:MAG: SDR family oxidoreductase [Gammaproteobacteria bacterium]|nr:SDR family oxidoreductase [Gammaproteobacteria bacterium]